MMYRFLLLLILLPSIAIAHKSSDSYLFITGSQNKSIVQWDIALRDLDLLMGLDSNRDRNITWGEVKVASESIFARALSHLKIKQNTNPCTLQATGLRANRHSDGGYATLDIAVNCEVTGNMMDINYNFLFEQDPDHRGILIDKREASSPSPIVFSPDKRSVVIALGHSDFFSTFFDYLKQGIWHIWIGIDHILFVMTLVLPAVLIFRHHRWQAISEFRQASMALIRVITAFTFAHSITLTLSILGIISLPTSLVESAIALSVIIVALNNLKPVFQDSRWTLAFIFGLIHGFGFASVLSGLGLPGDALFVSILAFNLGVEAGQLLILMLIFPLAWFLRHSVFYLRFIFQGGSVVISLFALIWLLERSMNIRFDFFA